MTLPRLSIDGSWFREPSGRRVLLRGVNLGGDCKVPFPDGGTNHPSDFADHRTVSFVGRPFPLSEADEHLGRLARWGFNCLRLLTTWEAVEHAGPGLYDAAYLDYFAEVARRAGDHGLYVFVDFHQDVWSRMTGGDGAPGWLFEEVGLDMTRFHAAGAAHVMQHKYDYARGGRQEDRYPTMTWGHNYRLPANGLMWTFFFAGRRFAPDHLVHGRNVQDFLQDHYLGAMRAVAERLRGLDHVLGFDTLNEPGSGFIGRPLSYRHVEKSAAHPHPVTPGPAWSVLDALLAAQGHARDIPELAFDPSVMKVRQVATKRVNDAGVRIWRDGVRCPFAAAGVYDPQTGAALNEDWFSGGVDAERDHFVPFFARVAETIRAVREDWLVFAEFDAFKGVHAFPAGMPERTVNASHWYDVVTLVTKTFLYPSMLNPFNGRMIEGRAAILDHYAAQLAKIAEASEGLNGGAPTLIGEFGIPFDLDGGAAYAAWARGDRSPAPWEKHVTALDLMYDAMDRLLLHSAQWNYTASNRNDLACGDGWNQEDLSIFSRDQQDYPSDPGSGGRALDGFVRPVVRACQGVPQAMAFDRMSGRFTLSFTADPAIAAPTEIFVPKRQYPNGVAVDAPGCKVELDEQEQRLRLWAAQAGVTAVTLTRR